MHRTTEPPTELLSGLGYGESPRWHDGRLWFANWGAREIVAAGLDGRHEVTGTVEVDLPYSIDWLPDGRLLVLAGPAGLLLREERDGERVVHADLTRFAGMFNELVVDGRGNAYVNGGTPDATGGFPPGVVVLVRPDGSAQQVADDIHFGNGMVITPDGTTLVVAESFGCRLTAFDVADDGTLSGRRVWADLGDHHPDGICLDADGAIWFADVPNRCCVRVAEGGAVLDRVDLDRGGYACMLGGPTGTTLFVLASVFPGFAQMDLTAREGRLLTVTAPAAAAGYPRSVPA